MSRICFHHSNVGVAWLNCWTNYVCCTVSLNFVKSTYKQNELLLLLLLLSLLLLLTANDVVQEPYLLLHKCLACLPPWTHYFLLFNSKISTLMSDAVAENTLVNRRLKTSPLKKTHLFISFGCFACLRWSDRFLYISAKKVHRARDLLVS